MDNFIYGCIEGSYAENMQTENSDLDIIEVYNAAIHMEKELKKVNDIKLNWSNASRQIFSSQSFIYNLFYEPSCEYYRWLFPYKYLSDNELTTYIKKYNEDIIKENLPHLYQRLMSAHDSYILLGQQYNNFKYYYYHEYLSTLCSSFNSIAISGTHGKILLHRTVCNSKSLTLAGFRI